MVKIFYLASKKHLFSSMKIASVTGLGGLWALKWAWQTFLDQSIGIDETNIFQLK